ncbi:hypothetical protein SARC_10846 [Sphaeroforma arctica JP610]|uniref:Transmembrane protein 230 n=1 Tax=Sphaeroforma arctica JP610 TaxID=667725 RepID=A0A0L0FKY2_9EUKA|nr:hypothetical protein SARC_10846 [Sphaeroforma arctica JP610]KNC76668.1 hypothetical protein SARC_10846 [Sphaeroforma arctica JP610]|eukprot:XP_014150570.1 hypothetical protein SARC_10846 [Sphaeroforma arctica JP610]
MPKNKNKTSQSRPVKGIEEQSVSSVGALVDRSHAADESSDNLSAARTTSVLMSMRSFEEITDQHAPEVDPTAQKMAKLTHNKKVAKRQRISDNKRTSSLIGTLCILSIVAVIAAIAFFATGHWETAAVILAVGFAVGVPGWYYAFYVRQGLKGKDGYDLRKIPMWHQPADKRKSVDGSGDSLSGTMA